MFWSRKKKKPNYDFDDDDRTLAAVRQERKKIEVIAERERIRRLKQSIKNRPEESQSEAGKMLRHFQEMDQLREYLTPEQQEAIPDDQDGAEKFVMEMIMQNLASKKSIPQDQDTLREQLASSESSRSSGKKDEIDLIIDKIPKQVQDQVRKGRIPKKIFDSMAQKQAKDVSEKVWKRLNSTKPKK